MSRTDVQWDEPEHFSRDEWDEVRAQLRSRPGAWGVVRRSVGYRMAPDLRRGSRWSGFEFKSQVDPIVGIYTTGASGRTYTTFARFVGTTDEIPGGVA